MKRFEFRYQNFLIKSIEQIFLEMSETSKLTSTNQESKNLNNTKDYVRSTNEQKIQLIDLVINEGYSMKLASEIVGIKLSTVKYIIKGYKSDKQQFLRKLGEKKCKPQKEINNLKGSNNVQRQPIDGKNKNQPQNFSINNGISLNMNEQTEIFMMQSFFQNNFVPPQPFQLFSHWGNQIIYNMNTFF